MLNMNQDFSKYAYQLQTQGRVQIPSYLDENLAEHLYHCLHKDVPWDLAFRDEEVDRVFSSAELQSLDSDALVEIKNQLKALEPKKYSYHYHTYMMVTAYLERRNPNLFLNTFLEMLNSPNYINFIRQLTGQNNINKINAQATKYVDGDFLRAHNDLNSTEGREFAYVINLTKDWKDGFGGKLTFLDEENQKEGDFFPSFNSLSIFKVPKMHKVSKVKGTDKSRYAITGWLLNK